MGNKFNMHILNSLICLKGKRVNGIFYQPTKSILGSNFYVINFGNNNQYSLHVATLLRIRQNNTIIMTSNDEFLAPDFNILDSSQKQEFYEKSLLAASIKNAENILNSAYVESININDIGDICIQFNNDIYIDILIDCQENNFEFYRFIMFNEDDLDRHIVVNINNGIIQIEDEN